MKTSNCLLALLAVVCGASFALAAESEWVRPGADGKLVYKTTDAGDRIMDFSFAGYEGGGVALPDVPVKQTVQPSGGADDSAAIQAAVDAVGKLPLEHSFRGAVLLGPGTFMCSKTITMASSGVVLRGSGTGRDRTTIKMTGAKHQAIVIGKGRGNAATSDEEISSQEGAASKDFTGAKTTIADSYVAEGTNKFGVADASSFAVGDVITIRRPTTAEWVHLMHMDDMKRDGKKQTWIGMNRAGITQRKITAIDGKTLTVDAPLADSYDAKYLGNGSVTVTKVGPSANVNHVGVENLHIQCPPLEIDYGHAPYSAIRVGGDDCWVRRVYCEETMNATAMTGRRITMEGVDVTHTFTNLGASKPSDFSIEGSQILIDRCSSIGGNTYWVWTSSLDAGPNVVLNSVFRGHGSRIQPHQRWSTGLLVDNCTAPDGGMDFMNRGVAGSGHGWTMGWAVAWNCVAKTYVIQRPPGAANWAIGCVGERQKTARLFDTASILEEGFFDSHGTEVAPRSLYLAQLVERLGPGALKNIGYASDAADQFRGKGTPPLPALAQDIDAELGADLAVHRPVNAGNVRENKREFAGENAVDVDDKTSWATDDDARRATLEIDMEGPVEMNALMLREAAGMHNVEQYKVEGQVDSDWKLLSEGTTIGDRKVDRFAKTIVWKVRLTILKSRPHPAIAKLGVYLQP